MQLCEQYNLYIHGKNTLKFSNLCKFLSILHTGISTSSASEKYSQIRRDF